RLLTGISFCDFKNAGDHTPISPFTIMEKDFHLKCSASIYDPHQHRRNCAILRPTFAIPLPAPLATGEVPPRASSHFIFQVFFFTSYERRFMLKHQKLASGRSHSVFVRKHIAIKNEGALPMSLSNSPKFRRLALVLRRNSIRQ